jgi:hypothetical protein
VAGVGAARWAYAGDASVGVFLLIVLGSIGILTSSFQIVLMVIRSGMLVILMAGSRRIAIV